MIYNTQQNELPMPEYGRSVQEMVDYAVSIQDREERTRCAYTIISIMGGMFPNLRDIADNRKTLWDHLALMSGYKLDIDYPVEITHIDSKVQKPELLQYSYSEVSIRHYGRIIPTLLKKVTEIQNLEEQAELVRLTALQMKKDLLVWNKELATNARVVEDIRTMTDGKINIDESILNVEFAKQPSSQSKQHQTRKDQKKR